MATTAITKSTIPTTIWKNFYDRIKDQVTTTTISISPGSQTIQTYASSYSDIDFSSSSNFPLIVIDSPRVPQEQFTIGYTQVNGTIDIEVFATNSQAADKFIGLINNAIETYKTDLAGVGLTMVELDDSDNDFFEKGNLKIHSRRSRFTFNYKFSRTRGF